MIVSGSPDCVTRGERDSNPRSGFRPLSLFEVFVSYREQNPYAENLHQNPTLTLCEQIRFRFAVRSN